ncbi:MAG TPA: M28 family peptidase, partial [Cytophagaceae bacterium]
MTKINFLLLFNLLITGTAFTQSIPQDSIAMKYASTITAEELSEHLHIIAADSMEGREAGEPGQKKAADYLVKQFKEAGLTPVVKGENGLQYFQEFELEKKQWEEVYIDINGSRKEFLKDFYAYGDIYLPEATSMKIVFGGFGIDSEKYSDYSYIDVKDKGVILFMGEPIVNGKSLVTGTSSVSDWANDWRKKSEAAMKKGAKAVFIVVGSSQSEFNNRLGLLKHHIEQPSLGFTHKKSGGSIFIPITMAAEMLKTTPEKLLQHKELPASTKKYKFKSANVQAKVDVKKSIIKTENVLGLIEGSDKKEEVIVITAHYDHIGQEGDSIYNGADDDGSGTVALIELGEAFAEAKKAGHGPRRSILIMPVTAEEKGLLGSEYYSDFPVFPLENTVANLNIDMIGRIDEAHEGNPDYVYIIGSDRLSTDLHKINENANATYTQLELDYRYNSKDDPNRFYYRSDHYN